MKEKERSQMTNALVETTLVYTENPLGMIPDLTPVMDGSWDNAWKVSEIDKLTSLLINTKNALFTIKDKKPAHCNRYVEVKTTVKGQTLLMLLKMGKDDLKYYFPMHQFNPYVELFLRKATERRLFGLPWHLNILNDDETIGALDSLNGMVEDIRREGRSAAFKNRLKTFVRTSNKNYRELRRYIQAHFDRYARLAIVRLDFGYLKKYHTAANGEIPITYEDVKQHWAALLKYLRSKLPVRGFEGFAYKLEYGLEKGFHLHVMLIFDASKVREDVTIARLVGEVWKNEITTGRGLYFNCNAFKSGYKRCGIGIINHDDKWGREGLEAAAFYLTKPDYYVTVMTPDGGRSFGKGNMPKPAPKMGRPRRAKKLERKPE